MPFKSRNLIIVFIQTSDSSLNSLAETPLYVSLRIIVQLLNYRHLIDRLCGEIIGAGTGIRTRITALATPYNALILYTHNYSGCPGGKGGWQPITGFSRRLQPALAITLVHSLDDAAPCDTGEATFPIILVKPAGIEPAPEPFPGTVLPRIRLLRNSPDSLTLHASNWSGRRELNPRNSDLQSDA